MGKAIAVFRYKGLSPAAGYGLAVGSTALAALARWLLPWALSPAPYLGFYPGVVVSAALGGVGPGLVATFGSLLLVNFVFGHVNLHDHGAIARQVIWVVASTGVSVLAGMQRAARLRESRQAEELQRLNDELELRVRLRTAEVEDANERLRAANEQLADLDRAKTVFFSNVSHELRTPLTLMLGPLEDALAQPQALSPEQRDTLAVVHRNALRLLRLVNTLLDFSRIEAGRVDPTFRPTELGTLTGDLAGIFRSAVEKAGLEFVVETPPLPVPVYVDQGMWEKIVLNLVANAFKYTLNGRIAVRQHEAGGRVELSVEDTGCGIPADALPNVFKRFHRIEGTVGRTHEGTGIGLSLVDELVRLHGGVITVTSAVGRGSTFTVSLPTGAGHLPADRIGDATELHHDGRGLGAYFEEVARYSGQPAAMACEPAAAAPAAANRPCVLVADDNPDMREYIGRLLVPAYQVVAVADGEAAWAAIEKRRPDLVLTDVMMPVLDGFQLLARLRAEAATRTLPVVMLSARAGEEARVEGLEAGADDYLVKPFSGRELVARVRVNLEMARLREDSARAAERLTMQEQLNADLEWQVAERTEALEEHKAELEAQNEELQDAYRQLEEEMVERLRAMEVLREQERVLLEQSRQAAMGEMLFNMAHHWRQPLNAVALQVQSLALAYECGEFSQELLEESVDRTMALVQQLSQTINEFTTIARPDPVKTRFRVDEVIGKALSLTGDSFREQNVAVETDLTGAGGEVDGYPREFGQVLLSLLANARDALFDAGVADGRVVVRAWAEAQRSVVTVTDNAGGIPDDILDRIFDPFFTTKEQGKGTGVGLYLAKTIIENKMGGRLTAANVGAGAEFRIEVACGDR